MADRRIDKMKNRTRQENFEKIKLIQSVQTVKFVLTSLFLANTN